MPRLEFTAMPKGMGPRGAWVFLDLPRESVETFGTKARVAVRLTVGGKAFRVSVFPDGQGGHQLNFNKAMQAATGWSEGKAVKVVVEADPKPRIVVVPKDLKAALAGDAKAKAYFDRLTPSHRKAYVEWIAEAKRPETRAIRVAETVARLKKSQKFW